MDKVYAARFVTANNPYFYRSGAWYNASYKQDILVFDIDQGQATAGWSSRVVVSILLNKMITRNIIL